MSLDSLFEGLQPQAGARVVNNGLGTGWESMNQTQTTNPTSNNYLDSLFTDVGSKDAWKAVPPPSTKQDEWFFDTVLDTGKAIGGVLTQAPQALYDWGEGFFTNKQTNRGITNVSEFENTMNKASSDAERQQALLALQQKWVITSDYFKQQQDTTDQKQQEDEKYAIQARQWFKDSLTEAVRPYLNNADKMQQKYILAAIDRETNQYAWQWNAINDSYDGKDFNKTDYFNKLNSDYANGIRETVVNFSQKIMEGKDSQTAYNELVPSMKDTFSSIAQFGLDVADKSNLASREHFYGKISLVDPMALLGLASTYVQGATQDYIVNPLEHAKQTYLSDYDVVEDLQKMGVYKDTANMWEKAGAGFSKIGGDIVSGIPQIAPVIGVMASELAIGNIPALATLTKGSKIRTAFGELAKDSLIYNGMVQASLGRGMTESDLAQNFMFDGPIDATLGLMEKPLKAELDETWMKKFGKDYGFEPTDKISQPVLDLMNSGNPEAAMTQHLADVSAGRVGDVSISSLDKSAQQNIGNMQSQISDIMQRVTDGTQSIKETAIVDNAAKAVLEDKTPQQVLDKAEMSNKIVNYVNTSLDTPDSYLTNKQNFNSISSMLRNNAIKADELSSTLDRVANDMIGQTIAGVKVSEDTANSMSQFTKGLLLGDTSLSKAAIDSPQKMQLFNAMQNELYKNIAMSRANVPWTSLGRYVVQDGGQYLDRLTGKTLDQWTLIMNLDSLKSAPIDKSHLESVYSQLKSSTGGINYYNVLGLTDVMNANPELTDFVKKLGAKGIVIKDGQSGIYPAVMAGRIRNILDGNINLYELTSNDVALMRMIMLPGIVSKWKTAAEEIMKDNAWNLWDKEWKLNLEFANPQKVNDLMKNVLKDGDPQDMVAVAGDIIGIDKNISHIQKSGSFETAVKKSADKIENEDLRKATLDELEDSWDDTLDDGFDWNEGMYPELSSTDDLGAAMIDAARVLHEVVDTVADDKALSQAVELTEDIIKDEFSHGIVAGLINSKSRKIRLLGWRDETQWLKENIGWRIIWDQKIEPMNIKSPEDQVMAITKILQTNGIDDVAFINKVVDSIGTQWVLPFEQVEDLSLNAIGKLIGWSRSDVKLKTGTLADVKNGIYSDIKNFISEVDNLKSSITDPIELYKSILRTKYNYSTKLYSHILEGEHGKYVNELYQLLQASRDVRFLGADVKIDKFMDSVRANLLKIEVDDIKALTYKSFRDIGTQEKVYRNGDQVWKVKRGSGQYYILNGKAPALISTQDIVLPEKGFTYIVTNDLGVSDIANPIKVSGLSDSYKFIRLDDLLAGNYDKGQPVFLSRRFANSIMKNDADKLTVNLKNDIVGILKGLIGNKDVKTMDIDVYAAWHDIIIQPEDMFKANTLFKIKTMESDIAYQQAMKTFINGFSTDTISGFKWVYNDILNDNKRMLEHIVELGSWEKIRTDELIEKFFHQFGVNDKSLISTNDVVDNMFNELYKYGSLYRTVARDTLSDINKESYVPLQNVAVSYDIANEYGKFLFNLPSNPDVMINNTRILDIFNSLVEENKWDITESFTALYSMMIQNGNPLRDIREGMTSLLQIYGFGHSLPDYIHQILFPAVDVFRAQQVADAVMAAIGGKRKQELIDSFNSKIKKNLEVYNINHFGTDTHLTKFIETVQRMGYINPDVNIYKAIAILGENGDKIKSMLKQIYNGDIIRLIDDVEGDDVINNLYQGIKSNISQTIDRINLGDKFKTVHLWESAEGISDEELKTLQEEGSEFISGAISTKQDIDVAGVMLAFKQSIDEMITEEAQLLKLDGDYSNTGTRKIVWSDTATYKIAGFGSRDRAAIIERLKSVKGKASTKEDLSFTKAIRGGSSKRKVSDDIYNALTYNTSANIAADAYSIISKADITSEHEFVKQVKPTFYFANNEEFKMTGESNLETAHFIQKTMDQIGTIQSKLLDAKNKLDYQSVDNTLFSMVTESGFKLNVNADALKGFPVWKGYLTRLYKTNPWFFEEPLTDMFLFKQLEQLNRFVNNVMVDIGSKTDKSHLFSTAVNPQMDVYRNLKNSIQNVIDNYSKLYGIGRTGFQQTMFEKEAYAPLIEQTLRNKKGLAQILSPEGQKLLKNISNIEVIGYTPIIKYADNGVVIAEEKAARIIPVWDIEDYIANISGGFLNKSEISPTEFGIENLDYHLRLTTKEWKVFDVKAGKDIEDIREVKLVGDNYKVNKEPVQDINHYMDPATAKEYQSTMDKFTC